jgi:CRP/FNR family transcriptional regulator, cyclic AMP receptor protein
VLDSLKDAELFAGLDDEQRRSVAALAREKKAAAGEILFRTGEQADAFYVVQRGRVDLTFPLLVMGQAKEPRFQSLEPGRTLAWSALVSPYRLTMSARATTDVELLAFERDRMLELFKAQPAIGHVVMSNLASVIGARFHELLALWVREVQRNVSQTYR